VAPSISRVQARHWLLVAGAAIVAGATGLVGAGGVLIGGTVIGLSLLLYAAALGALLRRRSRLAIGLSFVKLAALLGLGWMVFVELPYRPDPIGFAVGVSCLPAAAVWEALHVRRV